MSFQPLGVQQWWLESHGFETLTPSYPSNASFTALSMTQLPRARAMMVSGAGETTGACRVPKDDPLFEGCNFRSWMFINALGFFFWICLLFDAWTEVRNIPQLVLRRYGTNTLRKSSSLNTSKIRKAVAEKTNGKRKVIFCLTSRIDKTYFFQTTNHQPTKKTMMSVRFFKHLTWTFYFP